jgi:hypothetical protein
MSSIVAYSDSRTFIETPPRKPNIPPITPVIISVASIFKPTYIAKIEKTVAQNIDRRICGLNGAIFTLTSH